MTDSQYMERAIQLAWRGLGRVNPNPLVGAVIVKDGRIIGEGCHEVYGQAHAERNALASCTEDPAGATMYVTLEPCCHQGKQPPCTQAVIDSKVARVVVGSSDPNPMVAGKGVWMLREAGISVETDFLKEACDRLNPAFFHYIKTGRPLVVAKFAQSLDGRITPEPGQSFWLTGEESRRRAHEDRNRYAALLVGAGTVEVDDPSLTCRIEGGRNPLRIVLDGKLTIPLESQVVTTAGEVPTLVVHAQVEPSRVQQFEQTSVELLCLPSADDPAKVDLPALLDELGKRSIDSLIVEGGPQTHAAFFEAGLVDLVQAYVAPCVIGGTQAPGPVGGAGLIGLFETGEALRLEDIEATSLGSDVLLEAWVR